MLQPVLDSRVLRDAEREAGGQRGQRSGGVREEELEGWVAVECAAQDQAGDGLEAA